MLLDEATSALDSTAEQAVQEALDHLLHQQSLTTVIVAHRLRTVQRADCIAVLQHGHVVELGSHEALLHIPRGVYRTMVERAGTSGVLPDLHDEPAFVEESSPGEFAKSRRRPSTDTHEGVSGEVERDIQKTIRRLESAERIRSDACEEAEDSAEPVLPHDGVLGRGFDSSPFADYWLRHSEESQAEGVKTSLPSIVDFTQGDGNRDESVDSVLDATIDSLLDEDEEGDR